MAVRLHWGDILTSSCIHAIWCCHVKMRIQSLIWKGLKILTKLWVRAMNRRQCIFNWNILRISRMLLLWKVCWKILEAYLLDKNRAFKLVYDFSVAKGHLSKLVNNISDSDELQYWKATVDEIKMKILSGIGISLILMISFQRYRMKT